MGQKRIYQSVAWVSSDHLDEFYVILAIFWSLLIVFIGTEDATTKKWISGVWQYKVKYEANRRLAYWCVVKDGYPRVGKARVSRQAIKTLKNKRTPAYNPPTSTTHDFNGRCHHQEICKYPPPAWRHRPPWVPLDEVHAPVGQAASGLAASGCRGWDGPGSILLQPWAEACAGCW